MLAGAAYLLIFGELDEICLPVLNWWDLDQYLHLGLTKFNGFDEIFTKYPFAISKSTLFSNTTCGIVKTNYLDLIRSHDDGEFPWPGKMAKVYSRMVIYS